MKSDYHVETRLISYASPMQLFIFKSIENIAYFRFYAPAMLRSFQKITTLFLSFMSKTHFFKFPFGQEFDLLKTMFS